jgi:hypothetical protein
MKPKRVEKNKKASCRQTPNNWHKMNRKQRREMTRKIQSEDLSLEVVHPDAAGIDIGNESHYVAVPPTRDSQPVRRFGCTTSELKEMAVWLKQCAIRTIALQSTGVYWIAVYDILEEAGFEVYLGECPGDEELTRAQKRCAGESMADEAAHLWSIAELVSPLSTNPYDADLLAAAQ